MTMAEQLYEVGSKLPPPALAELCGGLEDSATFAGAPLAIQEEMRSEWD